MVTFESVETRSGNFRLNISQTILSTFHAVRWPVVIGLLAGILGLQWLQWNAPSEPLSASGSYHMAVQRAAPAVVNIYTTRVVELPRSRLLEDPFFSPFLQRNADQSRPTQTRLGSGVIIDSQGLVLTNYHVIQQASNIHVALQDGREVDATVLGVDPESDLALLRISLQPLPAVSIDNSNQGVVGDVVLAIGNPFGVGQTVTQGIISATGRNQLGLTTFEDFIQTDAAINPGNSGGALVNAEGQLIGINTAIVSRTGGNQGIGFAIPAMLAQKITLDLLEHGRVIRGYLGVEMHQLSRNEAEFFNLQHTNGLIITAVHKDSPADKAGVSPGDVVLSIGGHPMRRAVEALNQVAQVRPGTPIALEVYRNGRVMTLEAMVSERPSNLTSRS